MTKQSLQKGITLAAVLSTSDQQAKYTNAFQCSLIICKILRKALFVLSWCL